MAKLGNETKLVLKLAKERAHRTSPKGLEPLGIEQDPKLHEAYMHGWVAGLNRYGGTLDSIVVELEER